MQHPNADYIARINKILSYIDENLDNDLSLETVSAVGCYSPFHLHRLFKAITNETPNTYITRKRLEKTAALLLHSKTITVSELSLQYGFSNNSSFTRTFKKFYGLSPTDFRKQSPSHYSKIRKTESKNGQMPQVFEEYICNIDYLKNWIEMNAKIEIREMPKLELAFITQIGPDGLNEAFNRLLKWARPKGLLADNKLKLARIFHDSFKITEADKVRMSACIILKEPVQTSGEIGLTSIEKGKFIVGHFEVAPKDFEKSWSSLYIWMNEQGYQKADRNPFEIFHNNFNEHPEGKAIVDMFIPIL